MNKALGIGIGIAGIVIAFVIAGGSTMLNDNVGLPNNDQNEMSIGDQVSVTVNPSEEIIEEDTTEGKTLEVNIVDGVTATSTP